MTSEELDLEDNSDDWIPIKRLGESEEMMAALDNDLARKELMSRKDASWTDQNGKLWWLDDSGDPQCMTSSWSAKAKGTRTSSRTQAYHKHKTESSISKTYQKGMTFNISYLHVYIQMARHSG